MESFVRGSNAGTRALMFAAGLCLLCFGTMIALTVSSAQDSVDVQTKFTATLGMTPTTVRGIRPHSRGQRQPIRPQIGLQHVHINPLRPASRTPTMLPAVAAESGITPSATRKETPSLLRPLSTQDEWNDLVTEMGDRIFLVQFYATWCRSCMRTHKPMEKFASLFPNIPIIQANVEHIQPMMKDMRVRMLPTFIMFVNGKEYKRIVGWRQVEMRKLLDEATEIQNGEVVPVFFDAPAAAELDNGFESHPHHDDDDHDDEKH